MKLLEFMQEKLVLPELKSHRKEESLREMVDAVVRVYPELDSEHLFEVIVGREKVSSTGIGSGIAIPHAKALELKSQIVVMARSTEGIEYDSIDGKSVHLLFMILGPSGANEVHLKILARISKFLHDTHFRNDLLKAESREELMQVITEKDAEH